MFRDLQGLRAMQVHPPFMTQHFTGAPLRRVAAIVFLFAFCESYFGVGSLKNAFGSAYLGGAERTLAFLFGAGWACLFMGSVLLLLRRPGGVALCRIAAGVMAAAQVAGLLIPGGGLGDDPLAMLVTLSLPVFPVFLFVALPRVTGSSPMARSRCSRDALLVAGGALIPWIAMLAVRASGVPIDVLLPRVTVFLGLFMMVWCALPFAVLVLIAQVLPASRTVLLAGGGIGAAVLSLYGYGMIWIQGFNSFLMAVLPPVVFAGLTLGMVSGIGIRKFSGRG